MLIFNMVLEGVLEPRHGFLSSISNNEYTRNLYVQKLAQLLAVAQVLFAVTHQYYELCSEAFLLAKLCQPPQNNENQKYMPLLCQCA